MKKAVLAAWFTVILAGAALAADRPVPLANPGFEASPPGAAPESWRAEGDGRERIAVVGEAHGGRLSLKMENPGWQSSAAASEEVGLQVGRLYRLSGWLRTRGARTRAGDRYPTSVAAALSMESFPFTNHSPAVAADSDWTRVETLFIATASRDRVRLHLGLNGPARGAAWFDDISLEEVEDISAYIPAETVRWFGPAFRYTDQGWIFVHVEGRPYARGYQYGWLLAREIAGFIDKLAFQQGSENPAAAWQRLRVMADALMLRGFAAEYLEEMKGIADGAAAQKQPPSCKAGALDLLDIVALNSAIDADYVNQALPRTPHALSGQNFFKAQDDLQVPDRLHKCSSFLATGSATRDRGIVFGQIFMWGGYTGVHWNVICDVQPEKGQRLVYETFPGGIHSGSDFYQNASGIMIGETTVLQTGFDATGTPQANRIRRAAQYAASIDDVVRIMTERNNGLYTNDWLIGDAKTGEIAILLLGTKKFKLWRSRNQDFPGGTEDFLWSVNNAKDPEVRKEYAPNPANAPFDLAYSPSNRDLAMVEYYRQFKGRIDPVNAARLLASSPVNRPHACDGKVTSSEMARQLVFLAHYGKVTLREKFPMGSSRLMPENPNAIPHLTLGYTAFSPIFVADRLKAARRAEAAAARSSADADTSACPDVFRFEKRQLWQNTVYPASERENWFVSASAAYWSMLNGLPEGKAAVAALGDALNEQANRYLYLASRENVVKPLEAGRRYDRYGHYQFPRIRGTFLLHQLRLAMGNEGFARAMAAIHGRFAGRAVTNDQLIAAFEKSHGQALRPLIMPWLERDDLPALTFAASRRQAGGGWEVEVVVEQSTPYHLLANVALRLERGTLLKPLAIGPGTTRSLLTLAEKPLAATLNPGLDFPLAKAEFFQLNNLFDDFKPLLVVYGCKRQIEANHTLALNFRTLLADTFTEVLPPIAKDGEVSAGELAERDLVLLGGPADNALTARTLDRLGIPWKRNVFAWQERTYGEDDDGLVLVLPSPYAPRRVVYLYLANSALQLYFMTQRYQPLPTWGVFKRDRIEAKGYLPPPGMEVVFAETEPANN
jgi:hypothetical protein